MIERRVVRLVTVVGAAWWLVRVMVSRTERHKLNDAIQALDETTALAEATTPLDQLRGSVLRYDDPTEPVRSSS
jgi:hypothetical protein